jgi:hypothetical protein
MAHIGLLCKEVIKILKNKNMKQHLSLFLFLLPCLAWAQYPSNGNQKITLGEQTTADGLIYRGVASIDTLTATNKITRANKQDTSAFLLLDTVTNLLWHYKTASNGWIQAGGGTSVTTFSAGTTGLTPSTATSGAVTLSGTLAVANGGTGITSLGTGVATFLGTPSSANLALAVTNETGSGNLVFATQPVFTNTIGIGGATASTSGSGITFPATQSASTNVNTLDDYEEGTWTPTIRGSTVSGTYTPSTTTAFYTKIGNVVTVWCFVDMRSGTASGGTGVLLLEGLPFNYKSGSAFVGNTRFDFVDYPQTSSHGTFAGRTTSGSGASILFQISLDNADTETILISGFTTSSLLTTNFSYTTTN